MNNHKGFTLIELIVVIAIIGILSTLIINNLSDARTRARDAKRKQELTQLKTALRMYYNDYQTYPLHNSGKTSFFGCVDGDDECGGPGTAFATTDTTYMKQLPEFYYYEQTDAGEGFVVKVTLENTSDPDLTTSQDNCSGIDQDTDYVVCAD